MGRFLPIICLICVLVLALAAVQIFPRLPADSQPYVEKKYAGWNGVLRGWIASDWRCDGSFNRWLNACAADFEKRHEGVYLEFTEVDASAIEEMGRSGIRLPELVLFSPGVRVDANLLCPLDFTERAEGALSACGAGRAIPVAMGGYAWVYNRALCDGAPTLPEDLTLLPDDAGRCFSAAAIALLSGDAQVEIALPDAGIDLGLPAMAERDAGTADTLLADGDALTRFINGELPHLIVSQTELARLTRLRDAGRGPDWSCAATGEIALADQLLMLGVVQQLDAGGDARAALAAEFAQYLRRDACQEKLTDIGAFPVTEAQVYPAYSQYASMEAALRSGQLAVPEIFSEHSVRDAGGIVRSFLSGDIDARSALALCGYKTEGYESPT